MVACEGALAAQGAAALPGAGTAFGRHTRPLVAGEIIGSVGRAAVGEEVCFVLARFHHCIPHAALRALAGSPSLASAAHALQLCAAHASGLHRAKPHLSLCSDVVACSSETETPGARRPGRMVVSHVAIWSCRSFLASYTVLRRPPAFSSRLSRGRRPRSPLRWCYPSTGRDACTDRATPGGGGPRRGCRSALGTPQAPGMAWPSAGEGGGTKRPFDNQLEGSSSERYSFATGLRWDTAGNRRFSGARPVPGADVWLASETSRGLDPDGWMVRRLHSRHHTKENRDASAATRRGEFAKRHTTERKLAKVV